MNVELKESVGIKGIVKVLTRMNGGEWTTHSESENLVMTAANIGRDILVQWLLGATGYISTTNGAAVLDGTNTYSWATLLSDTYTLTADVVLSALTIEAGITVVTAGYTMTVQPANTPLGINWGAIGTGSTTPALTDTELETETNRTAPSFTQDYQFMTAIFQFYFSDSQLTNETYYEFGAFVGGSSSLNSGQIIDHALFGTPLAKVSGMDVTVQLSLSFT
jgi:hypothetical protein